VLGGLQKGTRSVLAILLIYTAVLIIYAVTGVYLIGGFNHEFNTFSFAMLELYLVAMLEWVSVMQYSIHGCIDYRMIPLQYLTAEQIAECSAPRDGWTEGYIAFYFISFVIVTGMILMTMFMGAISVFMAEVTRQLEKDAQEMGEKDKNHGIKEMYELTQKNSYMHRFLLCKDTLVNFDVARQELPGELAHKYTPRLAYIKRQVGGLVYLSLFTTQEKDAMFEHAKTTSLLSTAFEFLEMLDQREKEEEKAEKVKAGLHLGDRVRVVKVGSQLGAFGVVEDPHWAGRVKVQMDVGGTIKSYLFAELALEEAAVTEAPSPAVGEGGVPVGDDFWPEAETGAEKHAPRSPRAVQAVGSDEYHHSNSPHQTEQFSAKAVQSVARPLHLAREASRAARQVADDVHNDIGSSTRKLAGNLGMGNSAKVVGKGVEAVEHGMEKGLHAVEFAGEKVLDAVVEADQQRRRITDCLARWYARLSWACYAAQKWRVKGVCVFGFCINLLIACVSVQFLSFAQEGHLFMRDKLADKTLLAQVAQYTFAVECLIKICANGFVPFGYFHSNWNCFDFVILVIGFADVEFIMILRMARVFELFVVSRVLEANVRAFITGLKSFRVIGFLWVLVIFIYSLIGCTFFHANDPMRFRNLHTAMFTLFQVSTLDGLQQVLITNVMGCDHIDSDYGVQYQINHCVYPERQPMIACVFFVSYILVSNAVLLSVFLGIISISLEGTIRRQQFDERQHQVVRFFRKLFPGNRHKIKAMYKSFCALDVDADGYVTSSELSFAFSVVTGHVLDDGAADKIAHWMQEIGTGEMGDGNIGLTEFMQFMILKHITVDNFTVRRVMPPADKEHGVGGGRSRRLHGIKGYAIERGNTLRNMFSSSSERSSSEKHDGSKFEKEKEKEPVMAVRFAVEDETVAEAEKATRAVVEGVADKVDQVLSKHSIRPERGAGERRGGERGGGGGRGGGGRGGTEGATNTIDVVVDSSSTPLVLSAIESALQQLEKGGETREEKGQQPVAKRTKAQSTSGPANGTSFSDHGLAPGSSNRVSGQLSGMVRHTDYATALSQTATDSHYVVAMRAASRSSPPPARPPTVLHV
jgi:voltage-gated sodium channel